MCRSSPLISDAWYLCGSDLSEFERAYLVSAWIWMGAFSVDKVGLPELGATRFLCSVDVVCLAWILHQHFCPVCA